MNDKAKVPRWILWYGIVLTIATYLAIYLGSRALLNPEGHFFGVVVLIMVSAWASPKIAMWALRPIIEKRGGEV